MGVEYWLRKVSRILRGYYDVVVMQATRVSLGGDAWYDVEVWSRFQQTIYMDCLNDEELNLLVRALYITCGEPVWHKEFEDGFVMRFEGCVRG